jgi:hypothetical protein
LLPSFWGLEVVGGKNTAPEEVVQVVFVVFWVQVGVVVALVQEMEVLAPAKVLVVDPAAGEGLGGKWAKTNCWFGAPWDAVPGWGLFDFLADFLVFLF